MWAPIDRPGPSPADSDATRLGETAPATGDAPGPLTPGEAFGGRYHIIKLLGIGGMGAVYQAWDDELGVIVALKVIRREAALDPESAQALERRFKQELLLARQVTHKNVVRIHDLGEVHGLRYITMPFVNGRTRAELLAEQGSLPVSQALGIFRQLVAGMEAAHAKGIVHRDLKPANILFRPDGRPVIVDFGLAKDMGVNSTLTASWRKFATPRYMSHEQCQGLPVDARSDIYSLGVILWEMLTGHRIYEDANPAELITMHVSSPVPKLPSSLAHYQPTLDRLLAKKPEDRFQRAGELCGDITL